MYSELQATCSLSETEILNALAQEDWIVRGPILEAEYLSAAELHVFDPTEKREIAFQVHHNIAPWYGSMASHG